MFGSCGVARTRLLVPGFIHFSLLILGFGSQLYKSTGHAVFLSPDLEHLVLAFCNLS